MQPAELVYKHLAEKGVLLKQDKNFPSVVGIVTDESLSASWWSHPKAHLIFDVLATLSEHPDVLLTKLLFTKDTLIHRRLWPSFLAVAEAREPWQLRHLSAPAKSLLSHVDRASCPIRASGAAVKDLQARLLAYAAEVHTNTGRHEMALEPWHHWSRRVGGITAGSIPAARGVLEGVVFGLGATSRALPWPPARTERSGK
jgi:hypothetical protein